MSSFYFELIQLKKKQEKEIKVEADGQRKNPEFEFQTTRYHVHKKCTWIYLEYTVPKIRNKNSQKWNGAGSFPISTLIYLWAIDIFTQVVRLFCSVVNADRSWEYINRSQIFERRN